MRSLGLVFVFLFGITAFANQEETLLKYLRKAYLVHRINNQADKLERLDDKLENRTRNKNAQNLPNFIGFCQSCFSL